MKRGWSAISGAIALTCAMASVACSSSSDGGGGFGGTGGEAGGGGQGGEGGIEPAMVRVAHLAPDAPRPTGTAVNFFMSGAGSFNSIEFGIVTLYGVVRPGPLVVEVQTLGRGDVLASASGDVESGGRYTFIAHRDGAQATEMSLVFFDENVSDLSSTQGRLIVGHGVDDASWDVVQVVLIDEDPVPLGQLGLGQQTPPIDLDAGPHSLGFDTTAPSPEIDVGPFTVELESEEPLILFAIDRDTADLSALPEIFPIRPDTAGEVDPLPFP